MIATILAGTMLACFPAAGAALIYGYKYDKKVTAMKVEKAKVDKEMIEQC